MTPQHALGVPIAIQCLPVLLHTLPLTPSAPQYPSRASQCSPVPPSFSVPPVHPNTYPVSPSVPPPTHCPAGPGSCPDKFQSKKPSRRELGMWWGRAGTRPPSPPSAPSPSQSLPLRPSPYLDVELKVLIHGVDVVEDVLGDAWDDAHLLGIVQLALGVAGEWGGVRGEHPGACQAQGMLPPHPKPPPAPSPPWCGSCPMTSARRRRWCRCTQPAHLWGGVRVGRSPSTTPRNPQGIPGPSGTS